jgi:pilus assembly protein CpaE
MAGKIRIMIVDDNQAMRDNIRKLLELEADMEIACEAATGEEAIRKAKIELPDVILMDINMPGMDGIATTEIIANEVPQSLIIVVSVQGEQEYLRRAMLAGAKDYLVKPCQGDELLKGIRNIYERGQKRREMFVPTPQKSALGKVVTIFSTKGGVGKTTIAINMGVALGFDKGRKVSILDMDLQFGDVAVLLNLIAKKTIVDLVENIETLDGKILDECMTNYTDNVNVLAAPLLPEQADMVLIGHIATIINELRYHYDYIIIDTATVFNEILFNILDLSDLVIVVTSHDLPALKNVKICLRTLDSLNYSEDKIKVILNRAKSLGGIKIKNFEDLIQRGIMEYLPSDGKTVIGSINQGIPFVINEPDTAIAKSIMNIVNYITDGDEKKVIANSINKPESEIETKNKPRISILDTLQNWGSY